jgi:hypothetical protein
VNRSSLSFGGTASCPYPPYPSRKKAGKAGFHLISAAISFGKTRGDIEEKALRAGKRRNLWSLNLSRIEKDRRGPVRSHLTFNFLDAAAGVGSRHACFTANASVCKMTWYLWDALQTSVRIVCKAGLQTSATVSAK